MLLQAASGLRRGVAMVAAVMILLRLHSTSHDLLSCFAYSSDERRSRIRRSSVSRVSSTCLCWAAMTRSLICFTNASSSTGVVMVVFMVF